MQFQNLPQERYNAEWVTENGYGIVVPSFKNIAPAVQRLLEDATFENSVCGPTHTRIERCLKCPQSWNNVPRRQLQHNHWPLARMIHEARELKRAPLHRPRKNSVLDLILGGAALHRCGQCIVLNPALAAEGRAFPRGPGLTETARQEIRRVF
jgi:hypothetical protein